MYQVALVLSYKELLDVIEEFNKKKYKIVCMTEDANERYTIIYIV